MRWLRFERRCPIVLSERTPRPIAGRPDVLGITCARFAIEIEIKATLADYRADQQKRCRQCRPHFLQLMPKQFYYFAGQPLAERICHELPDWAGLLSIAGYGLIVVKKSPINRDAKKLSIRECVKPAHLTSNEAISAWQACEYWTAEWREGSASPTDFEI